MPSLLHRLKLRPLLNALDRLLLRIGAAKAKQVLLRLECPCAALHKGLHELDDGVELPPRFVNARLAIGHLGFRRGLGCIRLRLCAGQLADQLANETHG